MLNRVVTWEEGGTIEEPDSRHLEISMNQMGLKGTKPLKIQRAKEGAKTVQVKDEVDSIDVGKVDHEAITGEGSRGSSTGGGSCRHTFTMTARATWGAS